METIGERGLRMLGVHPSREEPKMSKVINCQDGVVIRGDDDDQLLANAREHLRSAHPDMVGKISDDQLLAMAEVVVP